jgi:hypothetical protein
MIYQPRRSDNYRGHNIQTYMYKNVKPDESLWNNQVSTAKLVELPRVYSKACGTSTCLQQSLWNFHVSTAKLAELPRVYSKACGTSTYLQQSLWNFHMSTAKLAELPRVYSKACGTSTCLYRQQTTTVNDCVLPFQGRLQGYN